MVAAFSTPILSVARDAVRDLEGHEALLGLWTIFTKCKESLPNGTRLENITWRLWHRELRGPLSVRLEEKLMSTSPKDHSLSEKVGQVVCEFLGDEGPGSGVLSHSSPTDVEKSRPSHIIAASLLVSCLRSSDEREGSDTRTATQSSPVHVKATLCSGSPGQAARTHLPELTETQYPKIVATPYQPQSSTTCASSQKPEVGFTTVPAPPKVVVVNPTPNPTPHPTPPTTPHFSTVQQGTRPRWLSPPPLTRGTEVRNTSPSTSVTQQMEYSCFTGAIPAPRITSDPVDPDRRSVSSITSSECSHSTSHTMTSLDGTSTSASSTGYMNDVIDKSTDLIGTATGYSHLVGNLPLVTLHRLGSLSTIQSISTDPTRKEAEASSIKSHNNSGMVTPTEKAKKSTNTPVSSTSSPAYSHVVNQSHHSPAPPLHDEQPTRSEQDMNSDGTGSREGSDHFSDLNGIGTLGGYTIAAAYPPPNMPVRKQVVVGAGKAKVKVAFRAGKSKAMRRLSAGSTADLGPKDKGHNNKLKKSTPDQRQRPPQSLPEEEEEQEIVVPQYAEALTSEEPLENFDRHARFNIGSNSDDGNAMAAGSGSSQSGGYSLGQRAGKMMDGPGRPDAPMLKEPGRRMTLQPQPAHIELPHLPPPPPPLSPPKSEEQDIRIPAVMQRTSLERIPSTGRLLEKAKGRAKPAVDAIPTLSSKQSKTKSKSTPNLGSLDPVLVAKLRDSPDDPLLPKGRPVVVDMESEYDSDTEAGSWSDEEVAEDAESRKQEQIKREFALQQEQEKQEAERQEQELLLRQMYLQRQRQQHQPTDHHAGRPTVVQRTHSSHYPGPNHTRNKGPGQRNRNQQQTRDSALRHAKLEEAAKEAQRQREMLQKLPRESFQDLAKQRANSVGLLTQLLKPNPEIFPPNHPYRRGDSISVIHSTTVSAMQPTISDPGPSGSSNHPPPKNTTMAPTPTIRPSHARRHMSTDEGRSKMQRHSPTRSPLLQLNKSSAALPVSSQVQVGSFKTKASTRVFAGGDLTMTNAVAHKPKGPPKDQEMEDESDSDPDTGKILVSKSIAEQKLKALAERKVGSRQSGGQQPHRLSVPPNVAQAPAPGDEEVPEWARVSQAHNFQERQYHSKPMHGLPINPTPPPVPIRHPYNLPLPAPPTTPRTTRRQMLSTELSESLRRNLLWERQVSKNNLAAMRRTASGGVSRHDGLSRLAPFTSIAPVVQLHAKGTIPLDQQEDPAKRIAALTEAEREEMKRHTVARNRSWVNDFHYCGW